MLAPVSEEEEYIAENCSQPSKFLEWLYSQNETNKALAKRKFLEQEKKKNGK